MKEALLGILAVGLATTAADAARLSMQFAGGGHEIAVAPSDSVRIEFYWQMQKTDTAKTFALTGLDLRFNVLTDPNPLDGLVPEFGNDPRFPNDGKFIVTAIEANPALPTWDTAASQGVGQPFTELNTFVSGVTTSTVSALLSVFAQFLLAYRPKTWYSLG